MPKMNMQAELFVRYLQNSKLDLSSNWGAYSF